MRLYKRKRYSVSLLDQIPNRQRMKRYPSLPKFSHKENDPLIGLSSNINFVRANKRDYSKAQQRYTSVNQKYRSMKTVKLENSFTKSHITGTLPRFYEENKRREQQRLREQQEREEAERIANQKK